MFKLIDPPMLLEWAHDLGRTYSFLDFHVHPFDVLTGDTAYQRDGEYEELFVKGRSIYQKPIVDEQVENDIPAGVNKSDPRALLLAARLKYGHTGSKVIADQLNAAGLSGALLLPVARVPGRAEQMLEASKTMFPCSSGLYNACAFPVGLPAEKLAAFFYVARERYHVRAIKLHPNLAGVDPGTQAGRNLIESTLVAAGALGLPIIIHGGRTVALRPSGAEEFGTLSHLEGINWGLSRAPVVIAHAGCYELTEDEAVTVLCRLDKLFEKYPNLMADTSNLSAVSLRLVLKKISRDRLLFGSDALYIPIWKAWLRFLSALHEVSPSADEDLVRIASLNPVDCLAGLTLR